MRYMPTDLENARTYTKVYGAFRGCDFTTDPAEIADSRSPDSLNMIADDAGFPQKRVGWRVLSQFDGKVNGLHYAHFDGVDPVILVHHGTKLTAYHFTYATTTVIMSSGMNDHESVSFMHGGKLYMLDGAHYYRVWYSSGFHYEDVATAAKIPTTGRGGHYETDESNNRTWSACYPYEEPNILSSKQINTFAGDGTAKDFWLTERGVTVNTVELYTSGAWTATTAYTKTEDATVGKTKITFNTAPEAHQNGAGLDSIRVTFTSTEHPAEPDAIRKCSIVAPFGYFNNNRIFVAGNPDHKNRDWACAVDDPTYWELNQWTDIGSDHTAIMGYLHYGDALAIIKQDDNQDAEIYIRTAKVQSDNSILFPVQQGVKGVGAISRNGFASLRDDALFYAREGVFAVAGTDASQQRTVQNRSFFVDNRMREETEKENAVAVVWNNRYLLCFPNSGHCYVADARLQTAFNESFVYEWFYWDNIPACKFIEFDGKLFFGTNDGKLCKFNEDMGSMVKYSDELVRVPGAPDPTNEHESWMDGKPIKARWVTKADTFGTIAKFKTLTKRGCTVMLKPFARSSVGIFVTTHNIGDRQLREATLNVWDFSELDFSRIDFNAMATPQVVPFNNKVKKFQQLQLKLESTGVEECFGVYGIQVQYIINNYIK